MLKALFFDMDETLCDTRGANEWAKRLMARAVEKLAGADIDGRAVADAYVGGIYREWTDAQRQRYMPFVEQQSEGSFRVQLIRDLLAGQGITEVAGQSIVDLQKQFRQ